MEEFSPHGLIISRHIDLLLSGINLSELLPYLYAKGLVSEQEWLSNPTSVLDARTVTERFLVRLMSKGSSQKEFEAFIQCLKESTGQLSHEELALTLEQSIDSEEEVKFINNPRYNDNIRGYCAEIITAPLTFALIDHFLFE